MNEYYCNGCGTFYNEIDLTGDLILCQHCMEPLEKNNFEKEEIKLDAINEREQGNLPKILVSTSKIIVKIVFVFILLIGFTLAKVVIKRIFFAEKEKEQKEMLVKEVLQDILKDTYHDNKVLPVDANPSVFEPYNLKYGISIKLPRHWRVLDKQLMDSIDTNTEVLTGVGQGNNDIVIAANYYENDTGKPAATARVSVRTKQTASQSDVEATTQADLDASGDEGYKITLSAFEKSGDSVTHITHYKMTKDEISGYIAVRADYKEIGPARTMNIVIFTIYLSNRIVKVTMSYDEAQISLLAPTINEIKKSIRIRK